MVRIVAIHHGNRSSRCGKGEYRSRNDRKRFLSNPPREKEQYTSCWVLAHEVVPEEAKTKFENGRLTITVPLAKPLPKGRQIPVK